MNSFLRKHPAVLLPVVFLAGVLSDRVGWSNLSPHPSSVTGYQISTTQDRFVISAVSVPIPPPSNKQGDPLSPVQRLANAGSAAQRISVLAEILSTQARGGWIELAKSLGSVLPDHEFKMLLSVWAQEDGPAAFAFAKEQLSVSQHDDLKTVVQSWALADGRAALQTVLASENEMFYCLPAVISIVARKDAKLAVETLLKVPAGEAAVVAQELAPVLAAQSPKILECLLQRVSDDEESSGIRTACYASLADVKIAAGPDALNQWTDAHIGDEAFCVGAIPAIVRTMPAAEALAWMENLPMDRQAAVCASVDVLEAWMNRDSLAASLWLTTHSNCSFYDEGAALIASRVALDDPAAATAWAQSVRQSDRKETLLQSLNPISGNQEIR